MAVSSLFIIKQAQVSTCLELKPEVHRFSKGFESFYKMIRKAPVTEFFIINLQVALELCFKKTTAPIISCEFYAIWKKITPSHCFFKANKKLKALARISKYLSRRKRKELLDSYIWWEVDYCFFNTALIIAFLLSLTW